MGRELLTILLVVALLILLGLAMQAQARTIAVMHHGAVLIALSDEPCTLPAITNMPHRATWTEAGRTYEGCFQAHPSGVILTYWDDGTVVLVPIRAFRRASVT